MHFTCEGAIQVGSLYLPQTPGRHPVVVWVHGAGEAARIVYQFPVFQSLIRSGIAVFTYDKRGVGESEGDCCPGDYGHVNLLTADLEGAVSALRSEPEVDPDQIGFLGASQAGWVAPRASLESHAAFLALASAAVLPYDQVKAYAELTGGEGSDTPFPSKQEIAQTVRSADRSGVDPKPFLRRSSVPALWLFGTADREIPVAQSVALLRQLSRSGKDYTITAFDGAGHGLLDTPPADPRSFPTIVEWIQQHVHAAAQ